MIEVYANNKKLNLPRDLEINLTWENPLFMQDSIPATYSMSFNLPATPDNLRIVGNTNRITAAGVWTEMPSRIVADSIIVATGKLILTETEKDLKFAFIGSLLPAALKEMMNKLYLDKMQFGVGVPFYPEFTEGWSLNYKNTIFENAKTSGTKFAVCPVRVADAEWLLDENSYGFRNASQMYLNMFNLYMGSYVFVEENKASLHASIFPQPYIHYLLDLVFGSHLGNNFFKNDAELKQLCMVTSFHKMFSEGWPFTESRGGVMLDSPDVTTDPLYVYLSSYFNRYPFNDFLKNLLNVFCCSLIPRLDGTWDITPNKEMILTDDCLDWSKKLAGVPVTSMQKAQKYGYGYSSEDAMPRAENYANLNTMDELMAPEMYGTYYIKTTGEVYDKKLKDEEVPGVFEYERKKSGLGVFESTEEDDKETFNMQSEVTAVKMRPDEYWFYDLTVTRYPWVVPEVSGDRYTNDSAPQIGFMRGFYQIGTKKIDPDPGLYYAYHYPLMTPFNYDQSGNKIGNYSLAWEGTDGLLNKFHKEFKEYIEKDRMKLVGNFLLTPLDLKNIDFKKKIYIRGKKYHIVRIETTLKMKGVSLSRCELMEA